MYDGKWKNYIHCTGVLLGGLGTLILGAAGIIALGKTGDVMREILELQSRADRIHEAVELLQSTIRPLATNAIIKDNPSLSREKATKDEISSVVYSLPEKSSKYYSFTIPANKRQFISEQIYKNKNPEKRHEIILNNLEFQDNKNRK